MAEELNQMDLVGEIGFDDETIKASDVEFYKGVTGRTDCIGIVSKRVKIVKAHYKKGVGYIMCRSKPAEKDETGKVVKEAQKALCCKKFTGKMAAKTRCGVVVVQYTTDRQGEINPKNLNYRVQAWLFGEDKYVLLRSYNKALPIAKNDIKILCTDSNFQKLQFLPASGSLWQKEQVGWKDEILEEAAAIEKKLPLLMGKAMSDEEILEAVGDSIDPPPVNTTGDERDLDSVLDGMA